MTSRRGALGLPLAALLARPRTAAAEPLDPRLSGAGWRLQPVRGRAVAHFAWDEAGSITVTARDAVGFLLRPFPGPPGRLAWRWRVESAAPPSDAAIRGADDRSAAVHVLFAASGPLSFMRRGLTPEGMAGRGLTYCWGGGPPGRRLPNPYAPRDGAVIILRGTEAPLATWLEEVVDVAADHRLAFGEEAPAVTHIALSADTDDRGGLAVARIMPPRWL
ncbi:DUF3047 domain-containing protein [Roseococcus sp. SDR]|uniref:DUF3047 domain-containing protein n=1 Tax=Roseococcus sp. SDR TaxID=2835532 RepID=UPI001BCC1E34|nr:DUF3047 domain-containing protein [Roseococcus sp. SDR]MBS7788531.1 DUF3047 domain-containing protein [Roseococcus sp. SDR]MBV1843845.1 DUF3047 domain-containing protein [Roseococcus sp. SDR]